MILHGLRAFESSQELNMLTDFVEVRNPFSAQLHRGLYVSHRRFGVDAAAAERAPDGGGGGGGGGASSSDVH